MTFSHADQRAYHRLHTELRASLLSVAAEQIRDYQALREDAKTLEVAGFLADLAAEHPHVIDEFERYCERTGDGTNRIIRNAVAKARRWQGNSPIRADTPLSDHAGSAGPACAPTAGPASEFSRKDAA